MKQLIIAPSVLSLDYSMMSEQLDLLNKSRAQWLHFDVMDMHFVPNLSFGTAVLEGMRKRSNLKMDVHLMVENAKEVVELFLNLKPHCITIHYEVLSQQELVLLAKKIQKHGILAGISFKPTTSLENIKSLLSHFDIVLVMGVNPGFGGQSFIENTPNTIKSLKDEIEKQSLKTLIEVDGGINATTGKICKDAGADILVAGSYVFSGDILNNIETLWKL